MTVNCNKRFRVALLTTTRAEYGLLLPVMRALAAMEDVEPFWLVTGTHLSAEHDMTVRLIENDGFPIAARIPILSGEDNAAGTSRAMARALEGFGDYFEKNRPDCLLVLGDRFEALAVTTAAFNSRIPVMHLHGGERTDGAADDAFRHCITKMSQLHFTATEEYRRRVIQLGEDPERVFYVGAVGVENIRSVPLMSLDEVAATLNYPLKKPFVLMTYHPVTLEETGADTECRAVLDAMSRHPHLTYLVTQANADAGGAVINRMMAEYAATHPNVCFVKNLGLVRYLSAMKEAEFLMGNSSSALIEAPTFGIPTVNIGIRQKGRTAGPSVIHTANDTDAICRGMQKALDPAFRKEVKHAPNPYEKAGTAAAIADTVYRYLSAGNTSTVKSFFDLDKE